MLSPQSQLLLRNAELFENGRWLIVNASDGAIFNELKNPDIEGFFHYFDQYQRAKSSSKNHHTFSAFYTGTQPLDGIVIYMPKAKEQVEMLLANIAPVLSSEAKILMVGENKSGIKSSPKLFKPYSDNTIKIDSARHCSLYVACLDKPVKPFDSKRWQHHIKVEVNNQQLTLCSIPGVFNHKQLDKATELLLNQINSTPKGNLLDFGCGTGVIGIYLAKITPQAHVTMTDVSAIALYCAEESAKLNDVDVNVLASNGLSQIKGSFDGVYTNPPFHTGIKTDYSVTENFLHQLPQMMKPGAELKLVANSFLQYEPLLEKYIGNVKTLVSDSKFKVCQSRNKG